MWQPAEDAQALAYVRETVRTFKRHLLTAYPDDERTKALVAKLRDVRLLYRDKTPGATSYTSGVFSHSTGVLSVGPRDGRGDLRSRASMNKTVLHELAHATRFKHIGESSHSPAWRTSFVWFLGIATKELGWEVDLPCSAATFYGLNKGDCPLCAWESRACGAFTGAPEH